MKKNKDSEGFEKADVSSAQMEDIEAMELVIEGMGKRSEINDREIAGLCIKFRELYDGEQDQNSLMYGIAVEFFKSRSEYLNENEQKQELEEKIVKGEHEKEKAEAQRDQNRERIRDKKQERY